MRWRALAYSLNNQLGFMVVGIGLGTEMSLNGTAAHAFAHILYKALLFMSMGAVLYRTGTVKGSELGGLYKSMPLTAVFCMVGAASISAFPLFSGFVSKALIISASAEEHHMIVYLVLLFASAGVFHHSGIKIPFFAFFAHDSGIRCKEAPRHMLIAMGLTATLCVAIGVYPGPLYRLLPFPVDFAPYTTTHVVTQLQLLLFSAAAFTVLWRTGLYPKETASVVLDTDWVYRRLLPAMTRAVGRGITRGSEIVHAERRRISGMLGASFARAYGPRGVFGRTQSTGVTVLWITLLLGLFLLIYLI
jgi:multicomponent Na+:H+ antiporter subunit D